MYCGGRVPSTTIQCDRGRKREMKLVREEDQMEEREKGGRKRGGEGETGVRE